jgi:secondary thiamine-phosphate synthase enzyme
MWLQRTFSLPEHRRGFHLITSRVTDALPELADLSVGFLQLFIQHTSASLTINENADRDVRVDMEMALNKIVPENWPYVHTIEGPDDMPAHVKSSLMSCSLMIPITDGRLALGTWQGIYLCEHRNSGGQRRIVATAWGKSRDEDG